MRKAVDATMNSQLTGHGVPPPNIRNEADVPKSHSPCKEKSKASAT